MYEQDRRKNIQAGTKNQRNPNIAWPKPQRTPEIIATRNLLVMNEDRIAMSRANRKVSMIGLKTIALKASKEEERWIVGAYRFGSIRTILKLNNINFPKPQPGRMTNKAVNAQ
ncbi:MAG: hypothetical protein HY014_00780 [Acidobacteria bacterium]|nr:hypothetical protein [Acidobacteriota bacterium]MBI3486687.1 hypothetical protein [Acidobacteriota bacterium]